MNNTNGYIDIHAHILPGVDDGSDSMEETLRMLQIALEQGIQTIIATPHFMAGEKNPSVEQLLNIRDKVQMEADKLNKGLKLLLGNELFYTESIVHALKSKQALTMAGSKYVLVEFAVRESYETVFRGMGELIRAGYAPILAHVERYLCLHKREDLISELVKLGCYIQMNSSSLMGGLFNTEAVLNRKLINQGLVHFVGSDCHDEKVRIPNMNSAAKALHKKCEVELVNKIFLDNPINILENTYL
ncbi:MAG: hypothetical protein PHF63_10025 [Herbinix sp.]|nr:hypothetical protein [Herbinix sp.]